MKTIIVTEPFSGYPQGAKEGSRRRDFQKGEEAEVPKDFADLVTGKGHAREKPSEVRAEVREEPAAVDPAPAKKGART